MVKIRIVLCLAVLAFSVTALAATKEGIISINGGRNTVHIGQHVITPPAHRDAKLKTIYSNLGSSSSDVYYADEGWTIAGSDSAVGEEVWIAMPFTPKKAAKVQEVSVAVGYVEGTEQVEVSLAADASGLPGKNLKTFTEKKMFTFGDCCTLDVAKDTKGIAVKAKKQYWIVVSTNTADATLYGAWCFTYNFATGTFAYQINGGGWDTEDSDLGAFSVSGT